MIFSLSLCLLPALVDVKKLKQALNGRRFAYFYANRQGFARHVNKRSLNKCSTLFWVNCIVQGQVLHNIDNVVKKIVTILLR